MKQQSMSLRTTLENFLNHAETLEAKKAEGEDLYEQEFQLLKTLNESLRCLPQYSCSYGEKDTNRRKNRYKDILPYDYTRVSLSEIPGVPGSDYVNANYIKGASGSLAYIASQGPLPHTVEDFWRMIWECEVQVVVMASSEMEGGKHKCERYWPYEDEERIFGNLTVVLLRLKQVCSDFLVRTMKVSTADEDRTIIQFHYVSWPDHGIPDAVGPILNMTKLVRDCQSSETLPVLVHCSAGCGRTGTICAIDYVLGLLRAGKLTDDFSLFQLISEMRKQRIAMVQTKEQYILVHRAVKELFEQHLKVMDSHHYENVDFSGCPMIKNDVDYEFIDVEDPDTKSIGKISDANTQNSDTDVSEDMRHSAEKLGVSDRSRKVPPLPRKRRTALPPPNSKGSDSDSCESQVRLLISTWNHGKPLPVDKSMIDNDSTMDDENLSMTDERIAMDPELVDKELDLQHSPTEVIIKGDVLPTDKAVVIRKPSIAKLRAIFEKNSDSGSPTSDTTEVPFARRTKHKKKDKLNPPDGVESLESTLQTKPSKRSRSPFKNLNSDNPEMRTVSTRYKDTALKVYSEFKQREGGQSEDGITPSESSPGSVRTEKSPPPERRPSPTVPEFLRRVGSRRGATAANRTTSVWYDQSNAGDECKTANDSKPEEKPALPIKRSKSMKVQSITENAFGLFRLPSPIRQRKVAAYLGVEDKKSSKESSPVPSSIPSNVAVCDASEECPSTVELETHGSERTSDTPPKPESNSRISPEKSGPRPADNLLPSPKYFRRFYSRSISQSDKDSIAESLPQKEKHKLHYFFGDRQPDVVAGSGVQESVQLVRVRSKSDDAPYCRQMHPDVVPSKNITDFEATTRHSSSAPHTTTPSLTEGTIAFNSSLEFDSPTVNKTKSLLTSPSSVLNQPPLMINDTPAPINETKESTMSVPSLVPHKYVNVVLADFPPPLPAKKNSPANSPSIRRQTKGILSAEDAQNCPHSSMNTPVPVTEVPDPSPSNPKYEVPAEVPITETRMPVGIPPLNPSLALKESVALSVDTVVPLPSKSQQTVPPSLLAESVTTSTELSGADGVHHSKGLLTIEGDESYQQIIRDCQEYLLSSGYSNVFPEMSRNLMMIEQSLEKYPRGGFVDLLSSIDDLSGAKIESKSDLRSQVDKTNNYTEKKEADALSKVNDEAEKDTIGSLSKSQGIETTVSDISSNNVFLLSSSPSTDVANQARDLGLCEDKCANNEPQLIESKHVHQICTVAACPAVSVAEWSHNTETIQNTLAQSSKVSAEVPLEVSIPDTMPTIDTTLNPVIRPEYEHLWLSQSGELPTLVKEFSECDTKTETDRDRNSCSLYKTPPVVGKDKSVSPVKDFKGTAVRRGSCDGSGEKDLTMAFINKDRAASASPQLSRIPVRCKRANSKSIDKDKVLDRKHKPVTSPKTTEPVDSFYSPTNSSSNQGECDDVFGGLSSPKLLKELSFQSLVDKAENDSTISEWQLNSYKMVKKAMNATSPTEEQLPKLTTSAQNKCNYPSDGDGPDTPLNRAIEEMETLAEVMEKKEIKQSRESIAKEKLEPPIKPVRSQVDGRPRKPQPLPRSILPGKVDSPVKIPVTVPNQEIQIPVHSLERKKRKEVSSTTAMSSRMTPSNKTIQASCEDELLLKGNVKCAVKSDENAFIYRPKRDRTVTLESFPPASNCESRKMADNKLNHEYEELDLNKKPPKPEKKKVENEYEEIFFRGSEPSQEKLIDIAKRASTTKEGVSIRPARTRKRSEETNESSPSDEEKRKSSDSAVVKCTLLLPVAGKVEIQCTPERTDPISPSSHVYETVGGSLQRHGRHSNSKATMIPKYTVVSTGMGLEERRPTVRKRSGSLKRKEATRKASLDTMSSNDRVLSSYLKTHHQENEATYSQLCKDRKITESQQDVLYSEVSKERSKVTQPYRRCLVDSPNSQRHAGRKSRYSKDDLELCPVVPPRLKRQSSASLRRNTILDTNAGAEDAFWWTHTLPGRLNNPALATQVSKWGEDWDSDEDCQPPVPAKTREAYMLPQPDSSSSGSSTVTPTDVNSPGHGQDHPFASKTKALTKFNLLSRFGLKSEVKGSEGNATTPGIRPVRSASSQHSTPRPIPHGVPGFGFPHRLPKKPQGPRDPPSSWMLSTPNRST